MPQFLIEVPHPDETMACARVVQVFLASGSHFLSNALWGCMDGVHSAWLVVDVANRNEALMVVPPLFRPQARSVGLNTFTMDQIEAVIGRAHP